MSVNDLESVPDVGNLDRTCPIGPMNDSVDAFVEIVDNDKNGAPIMTTCE